MKPAVWVPSPAFGQVLGRGLRHEQEAEHVGVEQPVKAFFRDGFERCEFVDAGVVDQHVEPAERFQGVVDQRFGVAGLRYVGSHRDRFSAFGPDGLDDRLRPSFAGRVIHDQSAARQG